MVVGGIIVDYEQIAVVVVEDMILEVDVEMADFVVGSIAVGFQDQMLVDFVLVFQKSFLDSDYLRLS